MAGEMKDEAINTLLDGIKKKVAEVKEEHKWKELFVSTGDFFIENPDNQTNFENDLYTVFSSDNMRKLAEKLKRKKDMIFRFCSKMNCIICWWCSTIYRQIKRRCIFTIV